MKKWIIFVSIVVVCFAMLFVAFTQTKPTISKSVQIKLNILPKPDFTLELQPLEIHTPIQRTVAFSATITSIQGFAGEVVVSVTGMPSGVTAVIVPSDTLTLGVGESKGVNIEFTIADDDTLIGWHTLTVTASSDTYN